MSSNVDFAHAAPGETGVDRAHPATAQLRILDAATGRVEWFAERKKFAICGFASSTRHLSPQDDPAWIIVGLNQLYRHSRRADAWFDIHAYWREGNVEGTDHPRWLAECGIPVIMTECDPSVPTAVRHPIETLIGHFGIDYFTSTVAHMIALATYEIDMAVRRRLEATPKNGLATAWDVYVLARSMYEEYTIGIFGIDLVVGTEYEMQRQCAEFWIGEAEGRGINLNIPPQSALLKQLYRYGYQMEPAGHPFTLKELEARRQTLMGQRNEAMNQLGTVQRTIATIDGAIQESEMLNQVGQLRVRGAAIPMPGVPNT